MKKLLTDTLMKLKLHAEVHLCRGSRLRLRQGEALGLVGRKCGNKGDRLMAEAPDTKTSVGYDVEFKKERLTLKSETMRKRRLKV